jgi:hypothetical protein
MVIVDLWSIIDTRTTLDSAAREYLRSYTEAADGTTALRSGRNAARAVLAGRNVDAEIEYDIEPSVAEFGPCQVATVRMTATVPAVDLPFLDRLASRSVSVSHTELVDAHGELTEGPAHSFDATPCAG